MTIEAMKQALEALLEINELSKGENAICLPAEIDGAMDALRTAIAEAEKQEPVAWKWHQAPVRTSWGHDMVVADLAIDKDNTVSVYCERDQTAKVEAMFTPPSAQPAPVQVSPTDFVDMVMDKEDAIGKPIFWAEWPNREKNHD